MKKKNNFSKHMALLRVRGFSYRRIRQLWQRHEFNGEVFYGPDARVPAITTIKKNYEKLMDPSCVSFENGVSSLTIVTLFWDKKKIIFRISMLWRTDLWPQKNSFRRSTIKSALLRLILSQTHQEPPKEEINGTLLKPQWGASWIIIWIYSHITYNGKFLETIVTIDIL